MSYPFRSLGWVPSVNLKYQPRNGIKIKFGGWKTLGELGIKTGGENWQYERERDGLVVILCELLKGENLSA